MQGKAEGISICASVDTFIFRAIDGDKEVDSNCNGIHVSTFHYRLDSSVGRASAFGAGGRGFESRGRTIPKV